MYRYGLVQTLSPISTINITPYPSSKSNVSLGSVYKIHGKGIANAESNESKL
jgi:hypothetical protein